MQSPSFRIGHWSSFACFLIALLVLAGCGGDAPNDEHTRAEPNLTAANRSTPIPIRWKFEDGRRFHWTYAGTIEFAVPGEEGPMRASLDLTYDFEAAAASRAGGRTQLLIKATRVRCESDVPVASFVYDSAVGVDETDSRAKLGADMFAPLKDMALEAELDDRGRIVELSADEELRDLADLGQGYESLNVLLEKDGLSSLYLGGFVELPEDPTNETSSWTSEVRSDNRFAQMKFVHTAVYAGRERVEGRDLEKFDLKVVASVELPNPATKGLLELKGGRGSGTLYFDREGGYLVESQWSCTVKMIFFGGKDEGSLTITSRSTIEPVSGSDSSATDSTLDDAVRIITEPR